MSSNSYASSTSAQNGSAQSNTNPRNGVHQSTSQYQSSDSYPPSSTQQTQYRAPSTTYTLSTTEYDYDNSSAATYRSQATSGSNQAPSPNGSASSYYYGTGAINPNQDPQYFSPAPVYTTRYASQVSLEEAQTSSTSQNRPCRRRHRRRSTHHTPNHGNQQAPSLQDHRTPLPSTEEPEESEETTSFPTLQWSAEYSPAERLLLGMGRYETEEQKDLIYHAADNYSDPPPRTE